MRPIMTKTAKKLRPMIHLSASVMLAGVVTGMMSSPAAAGDTIYQIDLNKTQILRLPSAAGAIVVGNPSIADISVHSSNIIMVVGRGFGETNLVILDQAGETMMDADIQVTSVTSSNGIRLFNGNSRETYSCAPFCQPSPVLGDDAAFIGANSGQSGSSISQSTVFDTPLGSFDQPQIQQATQSIDPELANQAQMPQSSRPSSGGLSLRPSGASEF